MVFAVVLTCGPSPLVSCSSDDVVRGLAQISQQLQGLSIFVFIVSCVLVVLLVGLCAFMFAWRRG